MPGRSVPAALLALLLSAAAVHAQEPGPAPTEVRASPERRLEDLWFQRKSALDRDDTAGAASRIEEMTRIVRAERLDRVTWLARGFAFEAYEHLREGNYERARAAFDTARRFDPRLAEAQTGYAWAALRAGRGIGTFLAEYRRSLWLRWETFRREGMANLYLLLLVGLWLFSLVVVAIFLVRYQRLLRHDVGESVSRNRVSGVRWAAGWAILLLPLLFWIGGAWILLWWCAVLARYMSGIERALAAAVCLTVIATAPLAARGVAEAELSADPRILAVEEALQAGFGEAVIRELRKAASEAPDSVPLRLLLATTYERAGRTRDAFEEYQNILRTHPGEPRALNNVGNLYMRDGQTAQAAVFFGRAAEADPRQATFFHNLALAQADLLRLADAETSLRRVQALDAEMARALTAARARGEEIESIPATVTREEVWPEVPARPVAADAGPVAQAIGPTSFGAVAALLAIGWSSLGGSPRRARSCVRCGEPFCTRCKKEIGANECCTQCIHVFGRKNSIVPEVRSAKLRQVERFARLWRTRVRGATLLLPGAGHLLAGNALAGSVLLAGWLAGLTFFIFRGRLLLAPDVPVLDLPSITTLTAVAVMLGLWTTANATVPKPPV